MISRDTMVCVPMKREAHGLQKGFRKSRLNGMPIAVTGVGAEKTRSNLARLIQSGNPKALLFTGVAGAIDPLLGPGDVIIPEHIRHAASGNDQVYRNPLFDRSLPAPNLEWIKKGGTLYQFPGLCHRENKISIAAADKTAKIVDMESWSAVDLARSKGIDCYVLRVVLDDADFVLPPFELIYSSRANRRILKFVAAILLHPTRGINALRLGGLMDLALIRLAEALTQIFEEPHR